MDYFFMSREDEEASKNPILVIADEKSGSRYARAVGCKGLGESGSMEWLIEHKGCGQGECNQEIWGDGKMGRERHIGYERHPTATGSDEAMIAHSGPNKIGAENAVPYAGDEAG